MSTSGEPCPPFLPLFYPSSINCSASLEFVLYTGLKERVDLEQVGVQWQSMSLEAEGLYPHFFAPYPAEIRTSGDENEDAEEYIREGFPDFNDGDSFCGRAGTQL